MKAMMEKPPLYTVIPKDTPERRWPWWLAGIACLCIFGLVAVALSLVMSHETRVALLEERIEVLELRLQQVAHINVNGHDYFEYDDDALQLDDKDEITVRGVLRRRRREANPEADASPTDERQPVPIYEQSYGIDLKGQRNEGLRLYGSLLDNNARTTMDGEDDPESAIKPYHSTPGGRGEENKTQVSNLWVPKRQRKSDKRYHTGRASSHRPIPDLHRKSRVKVTSSGSPFNSVFPTTTTQTPTTRGPLVQYVKQTEAYTTKADHKAGRLARKPKHPTKRQRRRRRPAPELTVAHFIADTSNYTVGGSTSYQGGGRLRNENTLHVGWRPAPWMESLGLNKKYKLEDGVVTVKQAGLYYVYAQILYHDGHDLSGFQVHVDQTPMLQCTIMISDVTMAEKANSCHTAGTTYIPQGGRVTVRDIEPHRFALMQKEKSFFGLIRLMDAPHVRKAILRG